MRARRLAALGLAAVLAGCTAPDPAGVLTRGGSGGKRPKTIGLLYPQVEPGAIVTSGAWPAGRRMMASEIAAVVHVALRGGLEKASRVPVEDLAEEKPGRDRVALLTTAMLREYSLNGQVPARLANELGRVTHLDAALLVLIVKFGPSDHELVLRSLAGNAKATGPAGDRINCGVVCAVVRMPGGQLLWEGGALESLTADGHTPEDAARGCVARLVAAYPWGK